MVSCEWPVQSWAFLRPSIAEAGCPAVRNAWPIIPRCAIRRAGSYAAAGTAAAAAARAATRNAIGPTPWRAMKARVNELRLA